MLLKCRPRFTHLWPHVQGSVFLNPNVSALHMNTHIPFSYLKSKILCVSTPSIMCVAQPRLLCIYCIHLNTRSRVEVYTMIGNKIKMTWILNRTYKKTHQPELKLINCDLHPCNTNYLLFQCVLRPCSVFLRVYSVLCLFHLTTCVCVCHLFYGPLRECLRARRFRAYLLLHLHLCAFLI